jgi:microcystin-dependent protein
VSISGGVSNSADNSGTPIAQTTNNANNNTDAPNGNGLTASKGGTSGTVVAHNNLQPYIVLNYIIKT